MADENDLARAPEEFEPDLDPDIEDDHDEESIPFDRSIEEPTPGEDIDPETYGLFWRLVVVFDVALLALALGPMFVYFEGDWEVGIPLVVLGIASFAYGVARYRDHQDEA